jgi:transcriptional regulator with XRE-family HTH domain
MPRTTANARDAEAAARLGAALRAIRELRGKSLRAVAGRVGLSAPYLHKLEAGEAPLPSPHTLHALARELSADYRELFILAGYPLPDEGPRTRPVSSGTRSRRRSTKGGPLRDLLREETFSEEEAVELARYLNYIRQNPQ